jgi:hypothetical protein
LCQTSRISTRPTSGSDRSHDHHGPRRRATFVARTPPNREFAVLNAIVKRRITAVVVGAVALVIGIVMLSSTEVKCGGKTMSEGQICETTSNGSTTRNTYDEQKLADQRMGYLTVGFGALALLVGGVGFAMNGRPRTV